MKKFKNGSFRLKDWDYGSNASYFITICTEARECYFGKILDGKMNYSVSGEIVLHLWNEIPERFSYARIGPFVIMPNHIHGIITIEKSSKGYIDFVGARSIAHLNGNVQSGGRHGGFAGIKNPMMNQNVSRIIHWFKGRCSYEIHKTNRTFKWQPRFHDRMIRTTESYLRIARYIENNPANWGQDKMNK